MKYLHLPLSSFAFPSAYVRRCIKGFWARGRSWPRFWVFSVLGGWVFVVFSSDHAVSSYGIILIAQAATHGATSWKLLRHVFPLHLWAAEGQKTDEGRFCERLIVEDVDFTNRTESPKLLNSQPRRVRPDITFVVVADAIPKRWEAVTDT